MSSGRSFPLILLILGLPPGWVLFPLVGEVNAGQQTPAFRTGVELIQITAVVRDRHGLVVGDLGPDAFELHDEGGTVAISAFAHVQTATGGEPDVAGMSAGADRPSPARSASRAFILLFDDLHTPSYHVAAAKRIAVRFVEAWVRPDDAIAVRRTSQAGAYSLARAGDRQSVLREIDGFEGHGSEVLHDRERVNRAQQAMGALGAIADAFGHTPGQRAVVLFVSEGVGYDVFNVGSHGSTDVVRSTERAIDAMRRANVVVHAIDPRGLASTEGAVLESGGAVPRAGSAIGDNRSANDLANARMSLQHLAEETGGLALVSGNDLSRAVARVGREVGDYYVLGFTPAEQACDGRFHRLRVKVRRSDVQVRARAGYVCGGAGAPAAR